MTVKIRMLGNFDEYIVGKVYDVDMAKANQLSGMGYAVIVEAAAPAKENKDAL